MTPDIAAIEARLNAATPQYSVTGRDDFLRPNYVQMRVLESAVELHEHARTDLRACVAEIRKLREVLAEVALLPYADSDAASLLETLRQRARAALGEGVG